MTCANALSFGYVCTTIVFVYFPWSSMTITDVIYYPLVSAPFNFTMFSLLATIFLTYPAFGSYACTTIVFAKEYFPWSSMTITEVICVAMTGAPFNFTTFSLGTMFYAKPASAACTATPWMLAQKYCLWIFFVYTFWFEIVLALFASNLFNHKYSAFSISVCALLFSRFLFFASNCTIR